MYVLNMQAGFNKPTGLMRVPALGGPYVWYTYTSSQSQTSLIGPDTLRAGKTIHTNKGGYST